MTTDPQIKVILPAKGSIGTIKPRKAKETIGIILEHPDFEVPYKVIHPNNRISAAHTGKFDYRWDYDKEEDAYLLYLTFSDGIGFAIKFLRDKAGQILIALNELNTQSPMFGMILRFKPHRSPDLFDDSITLIGLEFDKSPEANWP
ncbi:hypothetical protein Desca_1972 [Desulfotomaculum nigrificans CO-1-SRB]|uniref:Uncharacterized protein n=1 Tax=Desulfotomaculum nigrificans (strain DSM 14880 / VKM B-2319 / CO-1-SRB) TaxID=868595 RepID=F6B941_DESCC|nr:hypothetical protein [Desulfotomaculum nigrificans]AEF94813.1 hypothetical protein Desca_1972 [Desulfotomaculum nigrificans CO-1-SRB]